ncbi:MAG: hypothetical protein ACI9S8_001084 [Chlamydiales bacterium]|jgi:hypothetical protein
MQKRKEAKVILCFFALLRFAFFGFAIFMQQRHLEKTILHPH